MTMPSDFLAVLRLFRANEAAYRSASYNEAQARGELIDPMLAALGWDVSNSRGRPLHLRDVIYEDSLRFSGTITAPDYSLRVGGNRALFVEAKRPSHNLKSDPAAAFQLRRYGWSADLSLSLLTNFRELVVYDCRLVPSAGDPATKARLLYVDQSEFEGRWEELQALISRHAVYSGSLTQYGKRSGRGSARVDSAFLLTIEQWRRELAASLARLNPGLTSRQLDTAVTRTIDRIIFLRICEDRGAEPYGELKLASDSDDPVAALVQLYTRADDRYNSGLFRFRVEAGRDGEADAWTLRLRFDHQELRDRLRSLYFPESPYEFSVVPAEIIGQVYEQFLGQTIKVGPARTVTIEQKPEVRKAGGVFYTPAHIVRYCTQHALLPVLDGKRVGPRVRPSIRIVDPACGSGSFLIDVYQRLVDWYLEQYVAQGPDRFPGRLVEFATGMWRLSIAEKKRIVLDHVFGVDIDAQAVETTKLSLVLKVLEGETADTVGAQLALFHERALPDLDDNIKCGNSLVPNRFYTLFEQPPTEEARWRLNAFDWKSEFPAAFTDGGFDVVVGNPPYVFGEYHDSNTKAFLEREYNLAAGQYDTYWLFVERALDLLKQKGKLALVLPDALLARDEAAQVRRRLLDEGLARVYHCGLVFEKGGVSAIVVQLAKGTHQPTIASDVRVGQTAVTEHTCSTARFKADSFSRLLIHASDAEATAQAAMMVEGVSLGSRFTISRGEEQGKRNLERRGIPILVGEDVRAFRVGQPSRFVRSIEKPSYTYSGPKILVVKTGSGVVAAVDNTDNVTLQSLYNLRPKHAEEKLHAACAFLNSRVAQWYVNKTFTAYKLLFPQLNQSTLESLPMPPLSTGGVAELNDLGKRLQELASAATDDVTPESRALILRQAAALRDRVDELILTSYGLPKRLLGS